MNKKLTEANKQQLDRAFNKAWIEIKNNIALMKAQSNK